jgi:non-ribosomal peptide synthetase component E (peptide arylation enzyme)
LAIAVYVKDPEAISFDSVVGWFLDSGLAKWKLPEQIDVWDQPLPRTVTGKVVRRSLAEGSQQRRSLLTPRLLK